jgi:hypothetical protein
MPHFLDDWLIDGGEVVSHKRWLQCTLEVEVTLQLTVSRPVRLGVFWSK